MVDTGDLRHGTRTDMAVILTADDVVAKMWDDYVHRFGAEAYVMARYISTLPAVPTDDDGLDIAPRPSVSPA
ncbi:MAG: hypothetical protein WB297_18340 [Actinomycetota bacterium]